MHCSYFACEHHNYSNHAGSLQYTIDAQAFSEELSNFLSLHDSYLFKGNTTKHAQKKIKTFRYSLQTIA